MVADDYNGFLDGGSGNRIQDVLEKGSARNGKQCLRFSHPLRFTGSQNDRRYQRVSPHLLRFHRGAEIQVSQSVKERDKKHQQQNQRNESKKSLPPNGILEAVGLQRDNFLMRFTKVRGFQRFANTLKT